MLGTLIGLSILCVGFTANFYLFSQWLVYPKRRWRLRVCRPYLAIGWGLYLLGDSFLAPMGRVQGNPLLRGTGDLVGFIGLALTVTAAIRLLRANAAERRAVKTSPPSPPLEGVWPPPPDTPTP